MRCKSFRTEWEEFLLLCPSLKGTGCSARSPWRGVIPRCSWAGVEGLWPRVLSGPQSRVWAQVIEGCLGRDSLAYTLSFCSSDSLSLALLGPGLCLDCSNSQSIGRSKQGTEWDLHSIDSNRILG